MSSTQDLIRQLESSTPVNHAQEPHVHDATVASTNAYNKVLHDDIDSVINCPCGINTEV